MSGLADAEPVDGLWNWCTTGRIDAADVRFALSTVLGRPVTELGAPDDDALLCDVWHVGGDFPTLVDCYLAPPGVVEETVAGAVAVRLGVDVLLPDATLNPTRYVLRAPDGTRRVVHVDETETDDGTERRHVRPCTGSEPACAAAPERGYSG